jgi:hypothetical protein
LAFLLEFLTCRERPDGVFFFKNGVEKVGNVSGNFVVVGNSRFLPSVGMTRWRVGMTRGRRPSDISREIPHYA